MADILYVAEGEIEERFITFLKQNNFIKVGRFEKFNLLQNKLSDNSNLLRKRNVQKIYCILDTDCVAKENLDKLIDNIKKLKTVCRNGVCLLIQNKNFEDELQYVLDCKDLGKFFKLKHNTRKDLKSHLAQSVEYKNFISNENLIRYCSRPQNFIDEFENLNFGSDTLKIVSFSECTLRKIF